MTQRKGHDIEAMRANYASFAYAFRPDWRPTYFQTDILAPALEKVVVNDPDYRRQIITLPFRNSKTFFCVDSFIPFYLGHNPDHSIIVISYGSQLSRKTGRAIREVMKSDLYAQTFPDSVLASHSRAQNEFETIGGGHFYAGSFQTGVNGMGAQLLVIDDPHKNLQDLKSEAILERVREIYENAVMTRCEPGASVMLLSARWTPNDMIGWRIDEDGGWDVIRDCPYTDDEQVTPVHEKGKRYGWKVVRLQAEAQVDEGWRKPHCECGLKDEEGNLVEHGEPLWPERWGCIENQKIKKNPTLWESSYLLKPTVAGGYMLARTPPQYYEKPDPTGMNLYILCDPSMGRGKRSDRTAIIVMGAAPDQNLYLLDMVWDRMDLMVRMDHIFRLHRKWNAVGQGGRWSLCAVGYEEYGAQSDSDSLKNRMEQENYRFIITELGRSGKWHSDSKPQRISSLVPLASAGRIWLPNPKSPHIPADMAAMVERFVEKEWMKYPAGAHDDMLDVMARINDPDLNMRFPMVQSQMHAPQQRASGTSWLSW